MLTDFFEKLTDIPHAPLQDEEVYVYYDGPRLGTLKTVNENLFYLYSSIEENDGEGYAFLFVLLTTERLGLLRSGEISLYNIFKEADAGNVFRVSDVEHSTGWQLQVTSVIPALIEDDDLATPGLYLFDGIIMPK